MSAVLARCRIACCFSEVRACRFPYSGCLGEVRVVRREARYHIGCLRQVHVQYGLVAQAVRVSYTTKSSEGNPWQLGAAHEHLGGGATSRQGYADQGA